MHINSHWERTLNIFTAAAYHEKEDANHSRYEPTDYAVLKRLSESGYITRDNVLVDYGCGKGRVSFFMGHAVGCRTVGIEYSEPLYLDAMENLKNCSVKNASGRIRFLCENAENHIPDGADRFYFFNPFSAKILHTVVHRIVDSFFDAPREMYLFFYYALDSYLSLLMDDDCLELVENIDCRDLFEKDDPLERILVFKVTGGL